MTQADRTPTTLVPTPRRAQPAALAVTEHAPIRRSVRRRFLLEAGATVATALGVTAAVLAPDPDWSSAVDPDTELLALCRQTLAANASFEAHASRWGNVAPVPPDADAEETRLCRAAGAMVRQVADLPAHTLPGLHAKAAVVHAWWGNTLEAGPASLVADVLRLASAQVPA